MKEKEIDYMTLFELLSMMMALFNCKYLLGLFTEQDKTTLDCLDE